MRSASLTFRPVSATDNSLRGNNAMLGYLPLNLEVFVHYFAEPSRAGYPK